MFGCLEGRASAFPQALFSSSIHPPLHSSNHVLIHPSSLHLDRLLALQDKVERNSQAIVRLKTIWSFVAAGIALVVAALKDWLFGQR